MSIATGINGMLRLMSVSIASSELFIAFFISSKPGSRQTKGTKELPCWSARGQACRIVTDIFISAGSKLGDIGCKVIN
jgi:hypothetical protein